MKIVLLAGASSIHTIRWANGLTAFGHCVHVISQHPQIEPFDPSVKVHTFPFRGVFGYFAMVPSVKKLLSKLRPDIVNAHYASGYGTTARLVGYRPWLLSVWGSDVYDFPHISPVHRWLVKKNLESADAVASTSNCMAEQTRLIAPTLGQIPVTPFGVDMQAYEIAGAASSPYEKCVIGTVKNMAHKYGVDTLIKAFALLVDQLKSSSPELVDRLQLRLVGGGPQTEALQRLANQLGVRDRVSFVGRVAHKDVPKELSKLDIYVALSRLDSESFGVAVIEAGAARRPVVVSDAGGLREVTLNGETGIIVPRENPQAAADALERLVLNPDLRLRMGEAGHKHVSNRYSWDACLQTMTQVLKQTAEKANDRL